VRGVRLHTDLSRGSTERKRLKRQQWLEIDRYAALPDSAAESFLPWVTQSDRHFVRKAPARSLLTLRFSIVSKGSSSTGVTANRGRACKFIGAVCCCCCCCQLLPRPRGRNNGTRMRVIHWTADKKYKNRGVVSAAYWYREGYGFT